MVISLNSTIFIQMIGFLTLLFILNLILYKPVLKVIKERKETIDNLINQANELKLKAAEYEKNYAEKLEESEKTAKNEYSRIIASAMKEKEESIKNELDNARKSIEEKRKEIAEVIQSESSNIKQFSEEISAKIYEQLVG